MITALSIELLAHFVAAMAQKVVAMPINERILL
jgi:hypothetical protein